MSLGQKRALIVTSMVLAAVIGIIALLPNPGLPSNNSFILTNVTVFDGEQWHQGSQVVVIDGQVAAPTGRIEGLTVVDGQSGFVIPGLIDAHTHAWGDALKQSLQFGVTTSIDMFTEIGFMRANHATRAQTQLQAALFSAGTLVTSPGGHGTQFPMQIPTIESPQEARQFVKSRLREGSDFIKIVYDAEPEKQSFGLNFTSIDYATMAAVIAASHEQGKLAVVHIASEASALDAVTAGADGLVHSFGSSKMSDALLHALAENDIFVIPTHSVLASIARQNRGQALLQQHPLAHLLDAGGKQSLSRQFMVPLSKTDYWHNALWNTRAMHKAGIAVLAGSDAPNPGTSYGISLHDEVAILAEAGLTATEALQAATISTAKAFSLQGRGALLPGYRADMLLLAQDPRLDIANLASIQQIWLGGVNATHVKGKQTD